MGFGMSMAERLAVAAGLALLAHAVGRVLLRRIGRHSTVLSAVLAAYRLTPWALSRGGAGLIANPRAAHPLAEGALPLQPLNDRPRTTTATPVRDLFGLPDGWPGMP